MKREFANLYKKSKTGKVSSWILTVKDNNQGHGIIEIVHGYMNGKKQMDEKTITKGKNIGKENETTPLQQALSEAESKWKKQKDKGYVESLDDLDKIVYLPMLAHSYDKRGKDIVFPCVGQRKFDGVRCLAYVENGEVILLSRKGKRFPHMEHLFSQIKSLVDGRAMILDGELYSDDLTFQRTVGLVKKETLKDEDRKDQKKICYRLYDSIFIKNPKTSFKVRYTFLKTILEQWTNFKHIKLTQNVKIENEEDIKRFHAQFVEEGYEGIILRNIEGVYAVNQRSKDLQKYKHFLDEEFKIIGFQEGEGRAKGTVIWICETKRGKRFNVRPKGTEEERKSWFENGEKYIGSELTVRYFEETNDGLPRFPVGVCIRAKIGGEII